MKNIIYFLTFLLWSGMAWAERHFYSIDLSASTEYTDNLYLTENNKKDDWTSLFGGSFSASRASRISELSFEYDFERAQYWRYPKNNTNRHAFNLSYFRALSKRLNFSLNNNYYRSEEPIERNEEVFRERKGKREPYYRYTASTRLSYEFWRKSSLEVGVSLNYLQNKDPDVEDSRIYNEFIKINKDFVRYFASLGFMFTQREFETEKPVNTWGINSSLGYRIAHNKHLSLNFSAERTQEIGPEGEDYWTYNTNLAYTYSPTPDQTYGCSVGFYYRKVDGSSDKNKGFTYNLNYAKNYRHTTFSVSGSGGYTYEYGEAENTGFTEYYLISGSVSHQFTRTLTGVVSASYRIEDFKQEENRTDKTYFFSASLRKQLLKKLFFSIDYSYRKADSDQENESYTENVVTLKLTYNLWQGKSLW